MSDIRDDSPTITCVSDTPAKLGPHIEAVWTWPGHFAHDSYQRKHLPQINVTASGWIARVIGFVLAHWVRR